MEIKKCAMGVAWTSGLTALAITFLLFTFFDPGDVAISLQLPIDPGEFRIRAYLFTSVAIWAILGASVGMNCFYRSLRNSSCGCGPAEPDSASGEPQAMA